MREFSPVPDPSGSLQPPNRRPPTAVGAETSGPDPRPSIPVRRQPSQLERVLEIVLAVPVLLLGAAVYPVRKRARSRRRPRRA